MHLDLLKTLFKKKTNCKYLKCCPTYRSATSKTAVKFKKKTVSTFIMVVNIFITIITIVIIVNIITIIIMSTGSQDNSP